MTKSVLNAALCQALGIRNISAKRIERFQKSLADSGFYLAPINPPMVIKGQLDDAQMEALKNIKPGGIIGIDRTYGSRYAASLTSHQARKSLEMKTVMDAFCRNGDDGRPVPPGQLTTAPGMPIKSILRGTGEQVEDET